MRLRKNMKRAAAAALALSVALSAAAPAALAKDYYIGDGDITVTVTEDGDTYVRVGEAKDKDDIGEKDDTDVVIKGGTDPNKPAETNSDGSADEVEKQKPVVDDPSITYTVADVVTQTDLVAAKAMDATKASNASGVSLKFGHILTQINFTVKAADALTYKLKTLTISGVHNKGTYGFDDSTWKSQEGTATYAHTIDGGALEVNTTGVEVNTAWMLMPQTLDTNAKINVVYDIYEKDVLLDTVTSAIDLDGTQAWGEGKKIRYTLTLANKAAKVTFVPEVGPWSTADDTNVEK